MNKVTIKAPATSANIGPGFDTAGIAFDIYNTVTFSFEGNGLSFSGCDEKYHNENNLTYVAFKKALEVKNIPVPENLHINIKADIPVSRGLGSSAAMIVAGIMGANALCDCGFSREDILNIATSMEGHPDNVAPCVLGGLVVSFMDNGEVISVNYPVDNKFRFTAIIPDFKLSTKKARSVLPTTTSYKDAIFNISRSSVLYKAFEMGDEYIVSHALNDRLHQNFRRDLIAGYDEAESAAFSVGAIGFYLSGAGSTLMCVSTKDITEKLSRKLPKTWKVMPLNIDKKGASY